MIDHELYQYLQAVFESTHVLWPSNKSSPRDVHSAWSESGEFFRGGHMQIFWSYLKPSFVAPSGQYQVSDMTSMDVMDGAVWLDRVYDHARLQLRVQPTPGSVDCIAIWHSQHQLVLTSWPPSHLATDGRAAAATGKLLDAYSPLSIRAHFHCLVGVSVFNVNAIYHTWQAHISTQAHDRQDVSAAAVRERAMLGWKGTTLDWRR